MDVLKNIDQEIKNVSDLYDENVQQIIILILKKTLLINKKILELTSNDFGHQNVYEAVVLKEIKEINDSIRYLKNIVFFIKNITNDIIFRIPKPDRISALEYIEMIFPEFDSCLENKITNHILGINIFPRRFIEDLYKRLDYEYPKYGPKYHEIISLQQFEQTLNRYINSITRGHSGNYSGVWPKVYRK